MIVHNNDGPLPAAADGSESQLSVESIDISHDDSCQTTNTTMTVAPLPNPSKPKFRKRFGTMLVLSMFGVGYVMLADPSGAPNYPANGRTAAGRNYRKLSPGTSAPNFALWGQMLGGAAPGTSAPNFALWGQMLGGAVGDDHTSSKPFADLASKEAVLGSSNNNGQASTSTQNRDLFGISFLASPENGPECRVPPALPPPQPIAPTFAASYPGSGAKMSWNLITGLTGVQTGDDWLLNDVEWNQAVTVKTHFPHPQGNPDIGKIPNLKAAFPRCIIILRHPIHAIPGYHNYLYEVENGLSGHSKRAPVSVWNQWRDVHFTTEMDNWIEHLKFWTGLYGSAEGGVSPAGKIERQIVTYEGLVSDSHGPTSALSLAKFLDNTVGIDVTTDPSTVSCIWQKVIKYKGQPTAPGSGTRDIHSERSGSGFRPYSMKQYDYMISSLNELLTSHHDDQQLRPILESYIAEAQLIKATREEDLAKAKEEAPNFETIQPEAEIDLLKQQAAV